MSSFFKEKECLAGKLGNPQPGREPRRQTPHPTQMPRFPCMFVCIESMYIHTCEQESPDKSTSKWLCKSASLRVTTSCGKYHSRLWEDSYDAPTVL